MALTFSDTKGAPLTAAEADQNIRELAASSTSWGDIVGTLSAQTDLMVALNAKADSSSLSTVAASGAYADLIGKPSIPANPGDIGAATAAQGDKADTAVQPAGLTAALADKVDKVAGKGLSSNDYTTAEKNKLAGLEGSHFKGLHGSLAALQAAHPSAVAGDYADVDAGAGVDVVRYLWDVSDSQWVAQTAAGGSMTAAQVKTAYESNPDTNAFTDAEQAKLDGIAAGATANANTDSLAEGATNKYFTEGRVRSTVLTGLSLLAGGAIAAADSVLVALGKLQKQISDAVTAISGKQDTLVSGTNLKTVNGSSLLGSGDLSISGSGADWGDIGGTLADQADLQAALTARALVAGLPSRTITASGAVTPADAGKWLICTSETPVTLTIGAEATAAWTTSGILPMFHVLQVGAGAVTVTGDGFSVTLHASDTNVLAGAGAAATAVWRASNAWSLIGRLVAA